MPFPTFLSLGFGDDRRGMSGSRDVADDLYHFYGRQQKHDVWHDSFRLPLRFFLQLSLTPEV